MKSKYFFSLKFLIKGLLGYLAYIVIFPVSLCPLIHKLRGAKIVNFKNTYIAPNVLIDSLFPELVTIEEDVYITRGVKIITHFNPTAQIKKILGKESICGEVVIQTGAFIGVNSIILPNVTIGKCCVVGAGSIVTKSIPDYSIVAGNPAKVIGDIRSKKND